MKIVLDSNVLISALIKQGKPRQLLNRLIRSKHKLIISREILEEIAVIVNEPKIQKYVSQRDAADFLRDIATVAKLVEITSGFHVVKGDPDDDIVLQTAYDARAGYIITGDKHLLELGRFRHTRIITVEEILRII